MKGMRQAFEPLPDDPEGTEAVLANTTGGDAASERDRPKGPEVMLSARVPATLRRRFKQACVGLDRSVADCLAEALEDWLARRSGKQS